MIAGLGSLRCANGSLCVSPSVTYRSDVVSGRAGVGRRDCAITSGCCSLDVELPVPRHNMHCARQLLLILGVLALPRVQACRDNAFGPCRQEGKVTVTCACADMLGCAGVTCVCACSAAHTLARGGQQWRCHLRQQQLWAAG